jgi:RHS repeat-associated protein
MYDGMMVIQMRGSTTSSYTRGLDLSGSLQGAGGIGGLLAQMVSGAHAYYHSDGNGNVTYLMRADQSLGARYRYDDAYGNVVTGGGTLSNPFRFSSKEWMPRISLYYYGYRFYDASLKRWLNRDPIGESRGVNLYGFVSNDPINISDILGLAYGNPIPSVVTIPITSPNASLRDSDTSTWNEFFNDSSGYIACYLKCMGLDFGLEGAAEAGGAKELGRRYYTNKYPKWFSAGGRSSKVLVPKFAGRLSGLLALKSLCEVAHCTEKCLKETSWADPDPVPYVPSYSGGPVNAPIAVN